MDLNKKIIIQAKWAETAPVLSKLTDDELISKIKEYEDSLLKVQTELECAKAERHERVKRNNSKFAAEQREADRKYIPKPADKLEFDKKAKEERHVLSKEEKAIEALMKYGLSREDAMKTVSAGKSAS